MIFTDGTHLVTDDETEEELHAFAKKIGLKREWFQPGSTPHYDLTTKRMFHKAVKFGARSVHPKYLVSVVKKKEGRE